MPTRTFALPSGGQCTVREVTDMRARDKRHVTVALADADTETNEAFTLVAKNAIVDQLIVAWDLPYAPGTPVPRDSKTAWDHASIEDYDAIWKNIDTDGAVRILFPRPATPDDSDVPGSPTEPIGG